MFKTLRSLGRAIEGIGWIAVAGSAVLLLLSVAAALGQQMISVVGIYFAAGGILSAIVLVSYGQVIQCFVAIERNTRDAAQLLVGLRGSGAPEAVKGQATAPQAAPGNKIHFLCRMRRLVHRRV